MAAGRTQSCVAGHAAQHATAVRHGRWCPDSILQLLVGCVTTHTPDARAADVVALIEVDLNQFAEAATVVVAQRLGIAKRLQNGVGLSRAAGAAAN